MPTNNYPPCEWDVHLPIDVHLPFNVHLLINAHLPIDAHLPTDTHLPSLLTEVNLHVRLYESLQNCLWWKARVYLP